MAGADSRPARLARLAVTLAPAAAIAVLMLLPGLLAGPSLDAAVFTHLGLTLRAGDLPYRDAWDHKPPGIYLLIAFVTAALPMVGAWLMVWLSTAVFTVGTLEVLRRLLDWNRPGSRHGIALVAAAVALTCYPLALGGGNTESFAVLPATAAVLVAATGVDRRRTFAAGLLIGAANLLSLESIPAAVAVLVLLVIGSAPRGPRATFASLAVYVTGGLTVLMPVLTWLAVAGLLPAAIDAVIGYNAAYSALNRQEVDRLAASALVTGLILLFLIVPAVLRFVVRGRYGRLTPIDSACLAWVAATVVYLAYQGRLEPHYVIVTVPALVVLAAPTITAAAKAMATSRRGLLAVALPLAIVLGSSGIVAVQVGYADYTAGDSGQVAAVGTWIRDNTSPTDTIFVWGIQPDIYDAAGRAAASRWVYLLPLLTPGYSTPAQAADLANNLIDRRPAVIVDAGSIVPGVQSIIPPLLIPRPILAGDGRTFDALDPVRAVVRDQYRLAGIVDGWPVYVRR